MPTTQRKRASPSLPEDLDAFDGRLRDNSDRGAALIAAAHLDGRLEEICRRRMSHHHDKLLNPDRPLGTFSARITLARALDWIDGDVENDLNLVRAIRNRFAHSFEHDLDFGDEQVVAWCSSFKTVTAWFTAFDSARERLHRNYSLELIAAWRAIIEPPRSRFLFGCHFLAQHLKDSADETVEEPFLQAVTRLGAEFNMRRNAIGTA